MLKWEPIRGENGWQADGQGQRRWQITLPKRGTPHFELVSNMADVRNTKHDTLEDAQQVAWGFEALLRLDDRLKAGK